MFTPVPLLSDLLGGINSKQRPTKIKDNQSVSLVGFDFDANSFKRAPGYIKVGTEANVSYTGNTIYKHTWGILSTQGSPEMLVKTIGTGIYFLDTVSNNWYLTTTTTFTPNKRWCFKSYGGFMYGVNGVDNWIFWNASARSTLVAQANPGDSVITLATGTGTLFPNTNGTVMIENEKISFTGTSGDTLTGVSGITVIHKIGVTVIGELDATTYSGLEKAIRIEIFKNRMYAISAVNGTKILWSVITGSSSKPQVDLLTFTVTGDSGSGGFDYGISQLVAMISFVNGINNSILLVFDKLGHKYFFTVSDGTSSTTDTFYDATMSDCYPVQPHLIIQTLNKLVFVDQYGHIKSLQYGNINTPLQEQDESFYIHPSVEVTDFTNGYIVFANMKLYVGGATTSGGVNDITYYQDYNYNGWGSYVHWDAIDTCIYNAKICGLSYVTGDVFQFNTGLSVYVNDPTQNYQAPYFSQWVSREYTWKAPLVFREGLHLRLWGVITQNCQVPIDVFLDGVKKFTFIVDSTNGNILMEQPNVAVGTVVFGTGVFGGKTLGSNYKFWQAQLTLSSLSTFIRFQLRATLSSLNVDFELIDGMIWVKQESTEYWKPTQILTPSV